MIYMLNLAALWRMDGRMEKGAVEKTGGQLVGCNTRANIGLEYRLQEAMAVEIERWVDQDIFLEIELSRLADILNMGKEEGKIKVIPSICFE